MVDINRSLKKMMGKSLNIPKFGIPTKRDWDGDGIPNFRDCQPRNMVRQDNTEYRITFGNRLNDNVIPPKYFSSYEEAEDYIRKNEKYLISKKGGKVTYVLIKKKPFNNDEYESRGLFYLEDV